MNYNNPWLTTIGAGIFLVLFGSLLNRQKKREEGLIEKYRNKYGEGETIIFPEDIIEHGKRKIIKIKKQIENSKSSPYRFPVPNYFSCDNIPDILKDKIYLEQNHERIAVKYGTTKKDIEEGIKIFADQEIKKSLEKYLESANYLQYLTYEETIRIIEEYLRYFSSPYVVRIFDQYAG